MGMSMAGLSENQIDAKIARALHAQQERFQSALNEMAEVLAITLHHEMADVKTGGGAGSTAGDGTRGSFGLEADRSWRKEVKVMLMAILDATQSQGVRSQTGSPFPAGGSMSASMMETLARSSTPNQNIPQLLDSVVDQLQRNAEAAEQRVDGAVARLGHSVKDMQEMLIEMHSFQRSKPYTAEQGTTTGGSGTEAHARIDDATMRKFAGSESGDESDGDSGSRAPAPPPPTLSAVHASGGDEVLKLLRQLRHSQLLAFQQQEAEKTARVDIVQQLRGQLADTENKLSSVERELIFIRSGASGTGTGGGGVAMSLAQIAASSLPVHDPSPDPLAYDSPEHHAPEYRSSPVDTEADESLSYADTNTSNAAAPVLLGGYSRPSGGGRPAAQPPRHHFPHAHHHHSRSHGVEPDRPVSPQTAAALKFLRAEQALKPSGGRVSKENRGEGGNGLQVDDLVSGHNEALQLAVSGRSNSGGKPPSPPVKYTSPTAGSNGTGAGRRGGSPTRMAQYTESSLRKVGTSGGADVLNSVIGSPQQNGSMSDRSLKNRPAMRFNGTSMKPML